MIIGTKIAPPFAMKADDGTWSGISIELWQRIAADLHLKYHFEEASLDELISGTAAHRLDAAIAAIGVQDLHSVRVGTVTDTSAMDYLRAERIRFRMFPNAEAGLKAVEDGSLDAFVYDKPLMSWLVQAGYAGSLQVLDAVFDQQNYAIALPVGSSLRVPINRTMLHIIGTPWWRDMTAGYLGTD